MKPLYLYNSLGRELQEFKPLKEGEVKMYGCGPTVYNYAHIGHMRCYVFEDVLRRVLKKIGYDVKFVMNVTDVGHLVSDGDSGEDKLEKQSKKEGKSVQDVAKFYEEDFFKNFQLLNIEKPDIIARASEHVEEQIKIVEKFIEKGIAYKLEDGWYFDTSKIDKYSCLNCVKEEGSVQDRITVSGKRNKADFAVWKFSNKGGENEWETSFGRGFPGWHLECTAMSMKYLGDKFDIHMGGVDHIPVHHTNEIAQARALTGGLVANYWLHSGFLIIDGEKMSKSKGNFYRLVDFEKQGVLPISFRYYVYGFAYGKTANFSIEALKASDNALKNLYNFENKIHFLIDLNVPFKEEVDLGEFVEKFDKAVCNNLDMPKALEVVWSFVKTVNSNLSKVNYNKVLDILLDFDKVLGFGFGTKNTIPSDVIEMGKKRFEFKKNKEYEKADLIRKEIEDKGYYLEENKEYFVINKYHE